jgi:hypothetical protein
MSNNNNVNSAPAQFNSFSGELDLDDLQFLSDQQSEMLVGGIGMNGVLTNLPVVCAPPKKDCLPKTAIPCATLLPRQMKFKK